MDQKALFLHQVKSFVENNGFIFVNRDQNRMFMAERGMTMDDLKQVILSLESRDMFDGPEPDRDPRFSEKWTVAEFSPEHEGETLYLKLSVRSDIERCKCLSVKLYVDRREAREWAREGH